MERWRVVHAVHEGIAALEPLYREVIILRDLEGLTGAEVSSALGIEESAMKSRLHRARRLLRDQVARRGVVDEAPRVMISLTKYNLTHDLVLDSGVFALHLLASGSDEAVAASLALIMGLGGSSGRDGDKIAPLRTRAGVTGSPVLLDALSYVEGRVVNTMDADENTVFLADVVAAGRLQDGKRLAIAEAWRRLPPTWIEQYERTHVAQVEDARRRRGLAAPVPDSPVPDSQVPDSHVEGTPS